MTSPRNPTGERLGATLLPVTVRALLGAFTGEGLRVRAMALTYTSLFALVPALVVAFSVVQAFAGMDPLWRAVQEYLIANLAVGARASIEPYLDAFIRNAHATGAGVVGGTLLVVSAVGLFQQVERAVNDIWSVRRLRPLPQRVLIYWAGLTLGPLLLAASLALARSVASAMGASAAASAAALAGSALLSCLLFGALYMFVPSTRVRVRAAAAGGVVAGLAWELAKVLYGVTISRFFRLHAIYGSVAAVPIFLLWMYVSWTLLLFGARVSFVVQHARAFLRGHEANATPLGREVLAARAMLEVALAYRDGTQPPDPGEVAVRLETFGEAVRDVMGRLRAGQLVVELAGGGIVPARPLDQITLADVRRAMSGDPPSSGGPAPDALVAGILAGAEETIAESLRQWTFAELCARAAPAPVPLGGIAVERR